ncbi:beta-ketoacyl-ACP synthase II [Puniceicoccus vermicola]|uniref:3-oxoacyl-[acyl-carrier-protein] synthase 2 n=1 Tax=Puniceicoccus vermicola TaxID=388746 RepID=A0A7X1AX60_9BACT|nr:beta-ketoacyl-ACP synthase II [Puniceicoccus vermicola]MBC2601557.1 beta-ketoacyl-ACP synthase II [Puniceicoccus vermicola]
MEKRKVVVTGLGIVTSLGKSIDEYWESLLAGKSGIGNVSRFDASSYTCQVGAEVNDFDPAEYMDAKEARRNDRYTQFAVAGTRLALQDAALDPSTLDPSRIGVLIGSGIGGMETIEKQSFALFERGPRKVSPFMIPALIANMASGVVAIEINARGPNFGLVSACATGSHSIGESAQMIRDGRADIMIAGGSEAAITRLGYAGFCSMKAMSTNFNDDPQKASRPFDMNRDGFVMGEGSGILILESEESAKARGARIYCEVAGYAATCDAHHITMPDPEGKGLAEALRGALEDGGITTSEVDYVNAHGTSTKYNDKFETLAVKNVFGEHAQNLLMSSTKSMTGHLLGAAGGIEAAACCKAIETGKIPPTINYEEPDPDCDLNCVPNKAIEAKVDVAVTNNLGFGGHNTSIAFRRYA